MWRETCLAMNGFTIYLLRSQNSGDSMAFASHNQACPDITSIDTQTYSCYSTVSIYSTLSQGDEKLSSTNNNTSMPEILQ